MWSRRLGRWLPALGALAIVACTRGPPPGDEPSAVPLPAIVTGANLRPVGDLHHGYGTRTARRTLERLRGLGVNTIAVLMEGRMAHAHDPEIRPPDRAHLESLRNTLCDANALGFATVLIPHLYLDDGTWRGAIKPGTPEAMERWWSSYVSFIDLASSQAASCGTSLLSIGVELKAMSADPAMGDRMRALALRVRREHRGLVTYNANWDEAEDVVFWDAVDLVGVNGYYPLLPDPIRGAESVARRLTALAERAHREVVVLEVGYRASPLSHVRPWEWPSDVEPIVDDESQAKAWAAVLSSWLHQPRIRGLMVWVIPTDPSDPNADEPHGFCPLGKPAEEILRRAFVKATGAAS